MAVVVFTGYQHGNLKTSGLIPFEHLKIERLMLNKFAIFLFALQGFFSNAAVDAISGTASPILLRTELTALPVVLVDEVLHIVFAMLLALVGLEFAVLMSALEGRLLGLSEASGLAVDSEVFALIVSFIVVFFGFTVFVLVVGSLEAFDYVAFSVTLLDFLFETALS